ncbi:P-loop containing nucleoside triphosphate hydrolase protein [Aspergillus tamarii]|uniref:P-loop containing nucleoside triphosphate hydrolase protein n=1 Tax=Aspergillus tamarii TaxID=41984 RepID=A0A5N6UVQ4_ASPTM|nr:P-loop containing nucleoside triphosphate hydrolase protein [Aspergillus tamarii]
MGVTGVGKTTFISTLTDSDLTGFTATNTNCTQCTEDIDVVETIINGQKVHLIDTSGFDDTDLSETEIVRMIAAYLQGAKGANVQLTGLLYLHQISDVRMQGSALKNIRMFRSLVGGDNMTNVILVTMRWDSVTEVEGEVRLQ